MEKISDEVGYFFTAMTFLTRIPVARWSINHENSLLRSSVYFPLVGVCVGVICGLTYSLANIFYNENVAIILAITAGIISTGAFHEDGFADVLDSMGAFDKDKKLQIMKDSRLGTYGVIGLICLLLAKFFALQIISETERNIWVVFIIAHCLSRWSCLPLIYFNDYVSPNSKTGKDLIANAINDKRLTMATLLTALVVALLNFDRFFILAAAVMLVLLSAHYYFRRSFGGITGDCLGATNQITEVIVFLVFAALAR